MGNLADIVGNFEKKKVLVLGDVMLDKYVFGDASRISPEAPVPVVKVNKKVYGSGGSGNTAANITSLGGEAYLVSVVGDDYNGRALLDVLKNRGVDVGGVVQSSLRPTTVKERVIAQSQQIVRVDEEIDDYVSEIFEEKMIHNLRSLVGNVDVVVVSDYAKGVVTKNVMEDLIKNAKLHGKPVIVDPKPKNKSFYTGCDLITPNLSEAKAMVDGFGDLSHLCLKIRDQLDCNVLLTLGERGMKLLDKKGFEYNFDAVTKGVHDVTGAGDTATAVLALAIASGAAHDKAAQLANYAAGIVVRKIGAATTTKEELIDFIKEYKT
jgi:rfaE bifunctional protein kinase chain/domain